ncbi:MAG: flagellar filament outer layer protein FlaA [Spirochaetia bacterium]|jgi:hypothetical protein
MKRLFIFVVVGLFLGGTALFAQEDHPVPLIDFTKLVADSFPDLNNANRPTQNSATVIDFSQVPGATAAATTAPAGGTAAAPTETAAMISSLALENWQVTLASSARSIANQSVTMTKEAPSKANGKVLGIRIHFPVEPFNSWAIIQPPFDIPAYADKDTLQGNKVIPATGNDVGQGAKFNGFGVVKNVGVLRSLSITVYGANFPNGLGVVVTDQDGNEQTIFMDYLQFQGWRTLTWNNPNYITDIRNRDLRRFPLYPKGEPYLKIVGIVIYRDAAEEGGDFVTYLKDIQITFDRAIIEDPNRDIQDEAIWHILKERNEARRVSELKRLGNIQELRALEAQKMYKPPKPTGNAGTTP